MYVYIYIYIYTYIDIDIVVAHPVAQALPQVPDHAHVIGLLPRRVRLLKVRRHHLAWGVLGV